MDKVHFRPSSEYVAQAEQVFESEKSKLLALLPDASIHHIGSTSIPGSLTKGDLDINVRVEREAFADAVAVLSEHFAINQPDNWQGDFASYNDDETSMDVGIQLTSIGSPSDDFVSLRDRVAADPDLIEEYNGIKRMHEGGDMDAYRKDKAAFFQRLRS